MRVVINADDLGINPQVNDAIFGLMEEKRITSATLLANAPFLDQAVSRLSRHPDCSFGIHLNLTAFSPLTSPAGLREILDDSGSFQPNMREAGFGRSLREAIFEEFSAQVEHLQSRGVAISHMDSHHHIHTIPGLFLVLKRLQRTYGIRKVRISKNVYARNEQISKSLSFNKKVFNFCLRWGFPLATITDCFSDFAAFLDRAASVAPTCRSYEVMVHPGHPDFREEWEMLRTRWEDTLPLPIEMINYRQL